MAKLIEIMDDPEDQLDPSPAKTTQPMQILSDGSEKLIRVNHNQQHH